MSLHFFNTLSLVVFSLMTMTLWSHSTEFWWTPTAGAPEGAIHSGVQHSLPSSQEQTICRPHLTFLCTGQSNMVQKLSGTYIRILPSEIHYIGPTDIVTASYNWSLYISCTKRHIVYTSNLLASRCSCLEVYNSMNQLQLRILHFSLPHASSLNC